MGFFGQGDEQNAEQAETRARLEGRISGARGSGAVGVSLSHTVHRAKLALEASLAMPTP